MAQILGEEGRERRESHKVPRWKNGEAFARPGWFRKVSHKKWETGLFKAKPHACEAVSWEVVILVLYISKLVLNRGGIQQHVYGGEVVKRIRIADGIA